MFASQKTKTPYRKYKKNGGFFATGCFLTPSLWKNARSARMR
jgi:hypothetical protein